ncbi:acyltransferase family protein [Marinilabilia rubra]|uniref:Acyltransferase n=1 Tax=Marinilabilia rubra TaxID=2162893 RepID=A0A2U2BE79_9BACT|nr:acyltransferase [Marinilabilia rubra]PWE01333.1 acyltransferase [Marinilabilia rubra]
MAQTRKHFHTFDALRFFSFLLVFFHHLPTKENSWLQWFSESGGIGVSFFFVLSGFLITYILLLEKHNQTELSLKNFFGRRILRIWPLFYAMILFAFLTPHILDFLNLPDSNQGYEPDWLVSVLFLENYKIMLTESLPGISPLPVMWSLCVEEHFYILWGLLFFIVPNSKTWIIALTALLSGVIFRIIYHMNGLIFADIFTNIDYFAFGSIPAFILVKKHRLIDKVAEIPLTLKYLFFLFTLGLIFIVPQVNFPGKDIITPNILGFFFAINILFTLPPRNALHIKDSLWISRLGIYTYGLYLFHTIVISLVLQVQKILNVSFNWAIIATLSLTITIVISILSYNLFEKKFLKLKKYFYSSN